MSISLKALYDQVQSIKNKPSTTAYDYSRTIEIGRTYTASQPGIVFLSGITVNGNYTDPVKINGNIVTYIWSHWGQWTEDAINISFHLNPGDYIDFNAIHLSNFNARFTPAKTL